MAGVRQRIEIFKGIDFLGTSEVEPRLIDTLFTCFYGIKIQLGPSNEEGLDACGSGSCERCKKARDIGLDTYCDCFTDGEDIFHIYWYKDWIVKLGESWSCEH